MSYLREANAVYPVRALEVQESLWAAARSDDLRLGSGISATPSLHVAIATLQAVLAWKVSRVLGWAATIFLVLILVGSVHLGWHYAIDGYISILAVPVIWTLAGRLARLDSPGSKPGPAHSAPRRMS